MPRTKPSPYRPHLTRAERQRFTAFSRASLDEEIALLRVLNERQAARLAETPDPQVQAALEHSLASNAVLIARLMQIRAGLGQDSGEERLEEIAARLRQVFARPAPPGRDLPGSP
jgi:hypothetical protein